jgi:hypothetical protein
VLTCVAAVVITAVVSAIWLSDHLPDNVKDLVHKL